MTQLSQETAHQDVISVLMHDHREVEASFARLEHLAPAGERSREERMHLVDHVIMELVRHSVAEEEYLYPAVRDTLPDGPAMADRDVAEQAEAERTMNALDGLAPDDAGFQGTLNQLMRQVRAHIRHEEDAVFPKLREHLSVQALIDLGEKIQKAEKLAPTRPHPMAPDHPPFNKLLNPGTALVDRLRDAITGRGSQ